MRRLFALHYAIKLIAVLAVIASPLNSVAQAIEPTVPTDVPGEAICRILVSAAQANSLPIEFFIRVIRKESSFDPDEIGPVTRTGERALGIAQFMPSTAATRQLVDPFNLAEALPKGCVSLPDVCPVPAHCLRFACRMTTDPLC